MKILAIDSSGMVASAAVVEEEKVLAEFTVNNKKTHSQTLLPMIETLQKTLELPVQEIDAVAVAKGPGSFTGLRIGSATAKGIALAVGCPVVEVSTLEAMAYQLCGTDAVICPMMDARRSQVYTALFEYRESSFCRLTEDAALPVDAVIAQLNEKGRKALLLGDGVPVYEDKIRESLRVSCQFVPAFASRQRAAALGILALEYARSGRLTDPDLHRPAYLRLSQAERERLEREKQENRP